MWSELMFLVVGVIAGALAKLIMPGDKAEPKGCLLSMILGIAGAYLMRFIMVPLFGITPDNNMIASIIGATIGAIIIVFILRKFIRSTP